MVALAKEERLSTWGSTASSIASFFGGYQVCHNVCLGIITLLSLIGITLTGMPLGFLQQFAIPFWILAVVLLLISVFLYVRKKCISRNLLFLNTGILIMGIPFSSLQGYTAYFWIVGGSITTISIFLFIQEKLKRKKTIIST
ncbi:hypothetical protein HZB00_02725 [Candidatus Woesearchaeota archaeon]|nr:hypothetical protein [Candidatus Woesearchaeota archaeon]